MYPLFTDLGCAPRSAGSCGDPGTFGFNGTATGTASTDVTAPTMDVTKNVPADGATVGKATARNPRRKSAIQGGRRKRHWRATAL